MHDPRTNGHLHPGRWVQYSGNVPVNVWHDADCPRKTLVQHDYDTGWRIERVSIDGEEVAWAAKLRWRSCCADGCRCIAARSSATYRSLRR
jgi:hypothetical protein